MHCTAENALSSSVAFGEVPAILRSYLIVLCINKTLHFSITGIDKQEVGQFAAEVRGKRPPEPYKGKGIKYADEVIRRKVGKTGKK